MALCEALSANKQQSPLAPERVSSSMRKNSTAATAAIQNQMMGLAYCDNLGGGQSVLSDMENMMVSLP
jgi:hypothetical protein